MLGLKKQLRSVVRWFVYRYAERLDIETERVYWIVISAVMNHKLLLASVLCLGLAVAFFEGGSVGIFALAVTSITGDDELSLLEFSGTIGEYALDLRQEYGREGFFLLLVSIAILLQVVRASLTYLLTVVTTYLSTYSTKSVQERVVKQIMRMSLAQVTEYPAGELQAYFRYAAVMGRFIIHLSNFALTSIVIVVYVLLVLWVSPWLTLVSLFLCALFYASLNSLIKNIRLIGKKYVDAMRNMEKQIMEYLYAPKLLRAFGQEKAAASILVGLVEQMQRWQRKKNIFKGMVTPLAEISTVVIGGGALLGGYLFLARSNAEALPLILAFILILYRFMAKISDLSNTRSAIMANLASAERVAELLREDNKHFTRSRGKDVHALRDAIKFEGVSFAYRNNRDKAISDVSFEIPKGAFIGIVGGSGSGKSTLIDLLLGLYEPLTGNILFDDLQSSDANPAKWRKHFALVSQSSVLFHTSIRDNIAFGTPDATEADILRASRLAFCHEFIDSLDGKYDYVIGDQGHRLSGGQVQRLALARALVRKSDVLVLDEATSALDSISEQSILNTLEILRGELTIVSVAHRLSTIKNADRIVVMEKGEVIETGLHSELLKNGSVYKYMWDAQTRHPDNYIGDEKINVISQR